MASTSQAQDKNRGWLRALWNRGWFLGLLLVAAIIFVYQRCGMRGPSGTISWKPDDPDTKERLRALGVPAPE